MNYQHTNLCLSLILNCLLGFVVGQDSGYRLAKDSCRKRKDVNNPWEHSDWFLDYAVQSF